MRKRLLWSICLWMLVLPWSGCNNGEDDDATQSSPPVDSPPVETTPPAGSDADHDGYTLDEGDCDDEDASINPGATEIPYDNLDQDCNGSDLTDVDGDGYDSTIVAGGDDCDDTNVHTYPGAPEIGDSKDNDCDGKVDEDLSTDDADNDGYSPANGDCDDDDAQTYPGAVEVPYDGIDQDCSGADLIDVDGDGYTGGPGRSDCNDNEASIHPEALDIPYDGIDQDCSGKDLTDVDGDSYDSTQVTSGTDCDDNDANTYPGAAEIGDGKDNDCDGEVDDDLATVDHDGDGYTAAQGDCNDKDSSIFPGATEIPYDGIDQDCSGGDLNDLDGDGYVGTEASGNDCDDQSSSVHPDAQEVPYDHVDQDCDGQDLTDVDGDGHNGGQDGDDCDDNNPDRHPGAAEIPYDGIDQDCDGRDLSDVDLDTYNSTQVADGQDCDDADASIHPGATEIPYDKIDQDCSGGDLVDVDQDGFVATQAGGNDCDDNNANTYPGATEYADGSDNDCDGVVDNHINSFDDDKDGYSEQQGDCNDNDASIHPSATEVPYDGIDQDCDGKDLTDVDGDGYAGTKGGGNDCDDNNVDIHPGASETPYDGIDQDCTGKDLTDVDGDGYDSSQVSGSDCNDQDPLINPGGKEIPYDGVDQDCTGKDLTDVDGDGYDGSAVSGLDCNDANAAVHPGATELCDGVDNNCDNVVDTDATDRKTWYTDADHDGYGNPKAPVLACTQPAGAVTDATDCDDTSSSSHPGATEICDTKDNNCDGSIDENVQTTYYQDSDSDGFGNKAVTVKACGVPTGYSSNATDCDDTRANVYPGATESCDGLDNNCDTQIDEGVKTTFYADADEDGYGDATKSTQACSAPTGYVANKTDCNDKNSDINPGAAELCNSKDDNCNGQIDDGVTTYTYYQDKDLDGYGNTSVTQVTCAAAPTGYVIKGGDCDDSNPAMNPGATEACNGIDDNCNSQVDEGVKTTYYKDADGDGYGDKNNSTQACASPAGFVTNSTDCDDTSAAVKPGATETCNGKDDNCNGVVDEDVKSTWYKDSDNDGYGNPASSTQSCSAPTGYVTNNTDCNDTNAAVHPNAAEACNAIDDNCDGQIDEGAKTTWYRDGDGDGYGGSSSSTQACTAPTGYVATNTDCNDSNASVNPGATEACNGIDDNCNSSIDEGVKTTYYRDADGDTYGTSSNSTQACTAPTGYVKDSTDCDDTKSAVHPGATETCNAIDDNCDTQIDEGVKTTWYKDADSDTYGTSTNPVQACTAPTGYVSRSGDCDDTKSSVNPSATETCNSIDDNCNSQVDEGLNSTWYKDADSDGYGNASATLSACTKPTGYVANSTDCNDQNNTIYPGATEICDGLDNNCNTTIDDGVTVYTYYRDVDGDGYGVSTDTKQTCAAAPTGYVALSGDCNDSSTSINPAAAESCNGIDDNCNSTIDEGVKTTYYRDADGDGYGTSSSTTQACTQPSGYVTNSADCNDSSSAIKPGATETCDSVDNNCNGVVDEGVSTVYYKDADGDTYGTPSSTTSACSKPTGYVTNNTDCNDGNASVNPAAAEICDSIDNDCDSLIDDSDSSVTGQKTYYRDADGDGYGVSTPTVKTCASTPPSGYATTTTDCNDASSTVNPGATELCNSIDDNCNGLIDDSTACKGSLLVVSTGNSSGYTANVAAWLLASGKFSKVDSLDTTTLVLSTLKNYDAVLFYTNGSGDSTNNGNTLADFADTGKRLVVGTFSWANQGSNTLGGRFITSAISPFVLNGSSLYTNATIGSKDTTSAFMTGINAITGYYRDAVVLTSGSTSYATWSDGRPLLARKGNVVAVDLFPDDGYAQVSGDYRQLFVNALTVP